MKKKLLIGSGVLLLAAIVVGSMAYNAIWGSNINPESELKTLTIKSGSSFDDVVTILKKENVLLSVQSFEQVARLMNYNKSSVPSGKFKIDPNWSNRALISHLRSGYQSGINVTFNNHRTIEETLGDISSYLEMDSSSLVKHVLSNKNLERLGMDKNSILTLFIPNTYELYWNYTPEKLMNRMKQEYDKFWSSKNRMQKATKLRLTPQEVYTLAAIVEKESQAAKERPIIAGLYLNRIEQNIPLQADPTVVYAVGDFSIRRVLNKHLAYDSPYNTYKYGGLPPGPIYLPSIESIDAVLNPADHEYLFMCAKPGYNSEHAFAKSSAEHSRNANRYRSWLNSEGIRR